MSSICSISNVTRESSLGSAWSAHVRTRRLGGMLSRTSPAMEQPELPLLTCCHLEPFFQSEVIPSVQYWRLNSGLVMAFQTFSGVVLM